ncbi:hypothetical protein [Anaplasma marginale]|uniref:hypothetical protein n=1 Tax=Anaplasma marginale TaxID=770 RepID=UPI0001B46721|nr:hypothetical protein [Anaplasma marginale]KAA8473154.1 hypothetical protein F0Q58_00655 [Anaplasma marginale]KAB0451514.1 hypothetical protein FY210_00655 [Anaplasma marginale]
MEGNLINAEGGLQDAGDVNTQEAPSQYSYYHYVLDAIYEMGACAISVLGDYYNAIISALFADQETLGEESTLGSMQEHEPLSPESTAYAETRSRQFADWVSSLAHQAHELPPSDVPEHGEGPSREFVDWRSSLAQWMREQSTAE